MWPLVAPVEVGQSWWWNNGTFMVWGQVMGERRSLKRQSGPISMAFLLHVGCGDLSAEQLLKDSSAGAE